MARCNCTAKCSCIIETVGSPCLDLTIEGAGSSIAPYIITADLEISAVTGNALECLPDGLFVDQFEQENVFIQVVDGDCIDLAITGIGTAIDPYIITADIEISAASGNSISCLSDGLFAPEAGGGSSDVTIRKNSGADVGTRPRLNFIEGSNITLTIADDAGSNEVDITIASSGIAAAARVNTSQATTSTTYVDLATVGPSVTITTGTSVLVLLSSFLQGSGINVQAWMAVAVSGATTVAAVDANAIHYQAYAASAGVQLGGTVLLTGLTPGSNTFTAKYRTVAAATGTFANRTLAVVLLP